MSLSTNHRYSNISVAEYLRRLREERGLTQRRLAEEAGISASMVSLVENGERIYSADTLASVASVLSDYEVITSSSNS